MSVYNKGGHRQFFFIGLMSWANYGYPTELINSLAICSDLFVYIYILYILYVYAHTAKGPACNYSPSTWFATAESVTV